MCSEEELHGFSRVLAEVTASLGGFAWAPAWQQRRGSDGSFGLFWGGTGFGCSAAIPLFFNHSPVENKVWI